MRLVGFCDWRLFEYIANCTLLRPSISRLEHSVHIAHREITPRKPPLIVAEIGINHGGDVDVALEMVRLAADTGCECVKHQTHFLDDEMTQEARSIFPPNADISIWEVMERCALSREEEVRLKSYAESLGLIYLSTPFSRAAADFLNEIDVPAFKIGSGEADNLPLIRHIAEFGKPIIMSTGMQTIEKLRGSVDILEESGVDYALLECTNLYPSPPENVSLKGIRELRSAFSNAVIGFSDHSVGPVMSLAAIALGAQIVERHFTDNSNRTGPDIICSMGPDELAFLIEKSRELHIAIHNDKRRTTAEDAVYRFARASVVADRDLSAGQLISNDDIWVRRPGSGEIAGYDYDNVVGKTMKHARKRNTQLKWSDFID